MMLHEGPTWADCFQFNVNVFLSILRLCYLTHMTIKSFILVYNLEKPLALRFNKRLRAPFLGADSAYFGISFHSKKFENL